MAVNPVAAGSGSNLKLTEYLALGLLVVTTPVGLRGSERHAPGVIVAEPDHFAAVIADAEPLGGPLPAVQDLSWDSLAGRLHGVYARLLGI